MGEECIKVSMKIDGKKWMIGVVYMRENKRQIYEDLKKETEKKPGRRIMIGGEFNCRIGKYGERKTNTEGEEERETKDNVCNEEGKKMVRWMDKTGMHALNGNVKRNAHGEYTYVGVQGNTVIDYIVVNEEVREEVEDM